MTWMQTARGGLVAAQLALAVLVPASAAARYRHVQRAMIVAAQPRPPAGSEWDPEWVNDLDLGVPPQALASPALPSMAPRN